jgi:dTDP-4-dehydrorhamnose reductase
MKMVITGAQGQLGRALSEQSQFRGCRVQAPPEDELDITDLEKIDRIIALHQPDLVINTAAYTQVDKAESDEAIAFEINKDGCANLARICAQYQIALVHISTDYVFDGNKGTPYLETDPISPLGVYGRSKAEGEIEIRKHLKEHIILRTSWLYGIHGHNFVKTMLNLAQTKQTLHVVADQYGSPTNAADLAQAIFAISEYLQSKNKIDWGTYHYCGQGVVSWHHFTEKIVELARLHRDIKTARVEPLTTADYPTPAARPANSALDCSRIKKNFGIIPKPWQDSLEITVKKLMHSQ